MYRTGSTSAYNYLLWPDVFADLTVFTYKVACPRPKWKGYFCTYCPLVHYTGTKAIPMILSSMHTSKSINK